MREGAYTSTARPVHDTDSSHVENERVVALIFRISTDIGRSSRMAHSTPSQMSPEVHVIGMGDVVTEPLAGPTDRRHVGCKVCACVGDDAPTEVARVVDRVLATHPSDSAGTSAVRSPLHRAPMRQIFSPRCSGGHAGPTDSASHTLARKSLCTVASSALPATTTRPS